MMREREARLLDFCAQQRTRLTPEAWLNTGENKDLMAMVAFLLASMRWYGHQDELLDIAERLHKGCGLHFPSLVLKLDFDCSRFVAMLQAKLSHERLFA
jgi:hypothetical protein